MSKERPTGCTLDFGNVQSLATLWSNMVNSKLAGSLCARLEDKNSTTFLTLKQHDKNLLLLLRTWSQSTKIIANEIIERLQEIEKIIKEHPEEYAAYLKATRQEPQPSETPAENSNESHNE